MVWTVPVTVAVFAPFAARLLLHVIVMTSAATFEVTVSVMILPVASTAAVAAGEPVAPTRAHVGVELAVKTAAAALSVIVMVSVAAEVSAVASV